NRVLLSRIPVFPDSNLLLAPAIDTVNRLPILLYQNQFADTRILVTISDQHIRGALNVPLKGVRYVLRVADDIIGPTGDVMTLNGHYPYTEKVHSTKYHFTIIFNPPPLFSFYRLID
ncbi:CSS-motif domain-containing protein, partial [Escherichia coli]|nr:CSS-motif domain-containing protein [Escherichia coli]